MSIFKRNKNCHTLFSFKNKKWAYISYIAEVYYRKNDISYMNGHQNKKEALAIGKIFHKLNYNVTIADFNRPKECKKRKYDIIFGLEPNFESMCRKNPNALKIYYATGAFWKHQSNMVQKRTDLFNKEHRTNLAYSRMVSPHDSCQIADYIIQIGSSFTISTYPTELQNKIRTVNQSCNFYGRYEQTLKKQFISQKDFMWFGSSGSILKGLDLVIEYFMKHPEYNLHVVGPLDEDFEIYYRERIKKHENIILYGFLDTSSEKFLEVAYKSCANIFPSASEGGCPGSVITLMKAGVIPIVSKWAAFNEINEYGYLLKDLSIEEIGKSIRWVSQQTVQDVLLLSQRCVEYSTSTFNLERFEQEFRSELIRNIKLHKK